MAKELIHYMRCPACSRDWIIQSPWPELVSEQDMVCRCGRYLATVEVSASWRRREWSEVPLKERAVLQDAIKMGQGLSEVSFEGGVGP